MNGQMIGTDAYESLVEGKITRLEKLSGDQDRGQELKIQERKKKFKNENLEDKE